MTGDAADVDAISLSPEDNVATVLRAVATGEHLRVRCGQAIATIVASEPVPMCHKVSLAPIDEGAPVIKYGQPIGAASAPVAAGRHVHVHNMRSSRAAPGSGRG